MGAVAKSPEPNVDSQHLTVVFTANDDGWVTAQIEEFPAAISQGPTEREAWSNVLDALHDLTHEPTPTERVVYAAQARLDRLTEVAEQLVDQVGPVVDRTGRALREVWERHQRTRVH